MKATRPINVMGNPNWQYRNSTKTDVAATFARVRREQRATEHRQRSAEADAAQNVAQLKRSRP